MREIVSVPNSVRTDLERTRQYAEDDEPEAANAMLRAAGIELAKQQPEFCTLLIAGAMGHKGIEYVETEYRAVPMTHDQHMFSMLSGNRSGLEMRSVHSMLKS